MPGIVTCKTEPYKIKWYKTDKKKNSKMPDTGYSGWSSSAADEIFFK